MAKVIAVIALLWFGVLALFFDADRDLSKKWKDIFKGGGRDD